MSDPDPAPLDHHGVPPHTDTPVAGPSPAEVVDHMDPAHAVVAARAAHAKGAVEVLVLRVGDVLAITDYFVIASASNARLVRTVVQEIEQQVAGAGGPRPTRVEGLGEAEWVLADYGTFVVHVFHEETRRYYELERLWGDVPQVDWTDPDDPRSAGESGTR
jgi:ribosome-associated protein